MNLNPLPDADLVIRVKALVWQGNGLLAEMLAHLGEVDARRLYAEDACSSMFVWCTTVLRMSEAKAFKRIKVARLARAYPEILEHVAEGRLHLSGLVVLAPHLTPDNRRGLFEAATGKSRRQIEKLVADLAPKPDAPTQIRRVPLRRGAPAGRSPQKEAAGGGATDPEESSDGGPAAGAAGGGAGRPEGSGAAGAGGGSGGTRPGESSETAPPGNDRAPGGGGSGATTGSGAGPLFGGGATGGASAGQRSRDRVAPLGADRYKVQFTASQEWVDKLKEVRALASHRVPDGDVEQVLALALAALEEKLKKERFALGAKARASSEGATAPGSRHIPNAVKREVVLRDGGACAFVAADGRRCGSRLFLELHHRAAWGKGGPHTVDNIELRCRAHNLLAAREDYGAEHMQTWMIDGSRGGRSPPGT